MPNKVSNLIRMDLRNEYPILDFSKAIFIELNKFSSLDQIYKRFERGFNDIEGDTDRIKHGNTGKGTKSLPGKDGHGNPPGKLLAYVVNRGGNTVSVVDIMRQRRLADIIVGSEPFDLDISPDKRYVYVSNQGDDTLSVIRTSDNRVVGTIDLNTDMFTGNDPSGVKVSKDGKHVYVANLGSQNISVVNARERRVIATISLPYSPSKIDITKDGLFAYVTLVNDERAAVVDLSAGLFLKTVPTGMIPEDIRISPNRPLAFVSNEGSDNITAINTEVAEASPDYIPAGDEVFGLAFSPGGKILYAANYNDDTISVIDVFTHAWLFDIPAGDNNGPAGIAVTPDGRFLIVANYDASTLSIINTNTKEIIGTVPVGTNPQFIAVLDTGVDC